MRKLSLLAAAVFIFGANQTISAQAKVAHVDTNEIMSKMPAMLDAQKQLQTIGKTYEDAFKTMTTEYQTKLALYDKESATAGEKVNEFSGGVGCESVERIKLSRIAAKHSIDFVSGPIGP